MTEQEYLQRNKLGYEGDKFIHEELIKLVSQFKVELIIETGTYLGHTTNKLSELAPVKSIEINDEYYKQAKNNINPLNDIQLYKGDSPTVLNQLLLEHQNNNVLFFLDAHWGDVCPLLDELNKISLNQPNNTIIVIHDFLVPGRNDLGYDKYMGQSFTYEWIKPHIEAIYGVKNYTFHYNEKAEGAKRGVIYIYPMSKKRKPRKNK